MFFSKLFNTDICIQSTQFWKNKWCYRHRVSKTFLLRFGIRDLSNSIMNMSVNKGAKGETIAISFTWMHICPLPVKWTFLVHSKSSSFISFLVNDVNSWLMYILLRIMSTVVSNGTIVVISEFASNDTFWNPSGTFSCLKLVSAIFIKFVFFHQVIAL